MADLPPRRVVPQSPANPYAENDRIARPEAQRGRRPRKPQRRSTFGRLIGFACLLILAALGSYAGYLYKHSSSVRRYTPLIIGSTVASEFPDVNSINLMIIGRDYDYNNQDHVIKTHARSDMLMVAHIDFVNRTMKMLSIPRDTAAMIPGHGITKINAAHAFGGPSLAAATIEQNFAIKPDHYIALDFDGFQEAINLLGGVDCTVDRKMDYDDNWGHLHIHLNPGIQHLNGEQAMDFVRFRHADSDLVRTQRQQALLAQLKGKVEQPQTLAILPELLDTVDKHVDSDLTDGQKVALAKFVQTLPKDNVQMATLPSIEGARLVETNYVQAAPIVKDWFGVDLPRPVGAARRIARHFHRRRAPIGQPIDIT